MWQAYTAHDCGYTYAKKFGDAHEKDHPNKSLENKMDLYNNEQGRIIGSKKYTGGVAQQKNKIRKAILKAVKGGTMKRFVGSDIGKLKRLVPTNSDGIK